MSNVSFQEGTKGWPQVTATLTINEFVPQPAASTTTAPGTTDTTSTTTTRHDHDLEPDFGSPEHERRQLMTRKSRMQDIREAKDRRMKKVAAGLGGRARGRARLRGAARC